jgi:hypothetical protein
VQVTSIFRNINLNDAASASRRSPVPSGVQQTDLRLNYAAPTSSSDLPLVSMPSQ